MGELRLPNNIKVHFAACEVQNQFITVEKLGVRYGLYTAFPFVERMVFGKGKAPIMPYEWQKDNPIHKIPQHIIGSLNHTIQDSGLFTLMFGAMKGKADEAIINKWYDALVEFTLAHGTGATCVEVDCQKLLGVEKAWEFRQRMAKDIPNRIINVFHLEDGQKGLDRLIEYSNYIAISVPELRVHHKKNYVEQLARYIKSKKPSIDIHLLGCTEIDLLSRCNFCTSCDSTSWVAQKRFGFIKGHHQSRIDKREIIKLVGEDVYQAINQYNNEMNTKGLILQVEYLKNKYQNAAGNQDYYKVL